MLAYVLAWLFVFAVPWEDVVVLPGIGTLSKLLGIAAFGATILHLLVRGRVRRLASCHWAALVYLCWILMSALWAVNTLCFPNKGCDVRLTLETYVQVFVMMWVIWEATPTWSRLVGLMQAYVLGAYVAAGGTIFNYAVGTTSQHAYGRFAATGFDPNDLGMLLALAIPMAWYISSRSSSTLLRWLNRGYFLAGGVAILLTGSRGAMLAMIVAGSVVPWTLTQVRRGVRVTAVVLLVVAGGLAVRFVPQELFQRLSTTTTEISEGTMNERLEIWKSGLAIVPGRPFHGYGPAGWDMVLSYRHGLKGPHNTYLAVLVDEGLIGLLLYLAMLALVFKGLLALPTKFERRVSLALLATLATAMIPLEWDTRKAAWLLIGLLMACSAGLVPRGRVPAAGAALPEAPRRPVASRGARDVPPVIVK